MITKKDWQNVRIWIHGLADVQIVLYADEIKNLLDIGLFRENILWNDATRFQKLLYEECVERLRATLPEEDRRN